MRTHLSDDVLLDVLEGVAAADAAGHADSCADCARRVADARDGWALARGADVPPPSPLFWDAFPRRVASAIDAEPRRSARFGGFFAPAFLAAAAMVAIVAYLPRDPAPVLTPASLTASAKPLADEPATDAAAASGYELECGDVAACVADLSDEESRALADALRADLAGSGDL